MLYVEGGGGIVEKCSWAVKYLQITGDHTSNVIFSEKN